MRRYTPENQQPRHWKSKKKRRLNQAQQHTTCVNSTAKKRRLVVTLTTSWTRLFFGFVAAVALPGLYAQWNEILGLNQTYELYCYLAMIVITAGLLLKIEMDGWPKYAFSVFVVWLAGVMMWAMTQSMSISIMTAGWQQDVLAIGIGMACIALLFAATGRLRLSIILSAIFWFCMSLANFLVYMFRGEALYIGDLFSLGTAMQVSGNYTVELSGNMVSAGLMLAAIIVLAFLVPNKLSNANYKLCIRGNVGVICLAALLLFLNYDAESFYYSWDPLFNDYMYAFAVNGKMLNQKQPADYSTAKVEAVTEDAKEIVEEQKVATKKPTVIAIMNESFADLSVLGDFETTSEYMPFYNSMKENTIKGNLYMDVYGGGTCDSEWAFLTGNARGYVPENARPYQLYINDDSPSLATTLNDQGYTSYAMHPGGSTAWNRNVVYPYLGFSSFDSVDYFQTMNNLKLSRNLVSDKSTYDHIIEKYNSKKAGENQFIFDVTIANHGGYLTMTEDLDPVRLVGMDGNYPQTEVYLSLIKRSDNELKELITYFQNQDEPVVICFFGDHQPSTEQGFSEELMGKPLAEWTEEEMQKRYITPFFIWANYDIPEETVDAMSVNYLSTKLLETAGLEKTAYNEYESDLYKTLPVISSKGVLDKDGNYYGLNDASSPYASTLKDYHMVMYNNLYDAKHRCNDIFYLPDSKKLEPAESDDQ